MLFSSICKRHNVARVVDDYPGYFAIYKEFKIPERIGLLRSKLFSQQDYMNRGATKVVESWKQLQNDLPNRSAGYLGFLGRFLTGNFLTAALLNKREMSTRQR